MSLKYHQATFELLNITPEIDPDAVALLDALEARRGIKLPESVYEWYSIKNAAKYLTGNDRPVLVAELDVDEADDESAHDLILVVIEHQGVCSWAVKLDESDNPPVLIYNKQHKQWEHYADTFSEFCFVRVWDWGDKIKYWLYVYSHTFTDKTHSALKQAYPLKPVTQGYPVLYDDLYTGYRFGSNDTRMLIWQCSRDADGMLMAERAEDLIAAAKVLFADCDLPGLDWWSENPDQDAVLQQIRDWKAGR